MQNGFFQVYFYLVHACASWGKYMSHSKCFSSGIGERQVKECYLAPLEVWIGGHHFPCMPCGWVWQRPLIRGSCLSSTGCPDSLPAYLSAFLPAFFPSLFFILFIFFSEISTWEKLDSFKYDNTYKWNRKFSDANSCSHY